MRAGESGCCKGETTSSAASECAKGDEDDDFPRVAAGAVLVEVDEDDDEEGDVGEVAPFWVLLPSAPDT